MRSFGTKEQYEYGANKLLPKIQALLEAKYPDCTVEKTGVFFPTLTIASRKIHLFIHAIQESGDWDFTLNDFNHPPGMTAYSSRPAKEDADRTIKTLSHSLSQLDAYLAALHK